MLIKFSLRILRTRTFPTWSSFFTLIFALQIAFHSVVINFFIFFLVSSPFWFPVIFHSLCIFNLPRDVLRSWAKIFLVRFLLTSSLWFEFLQGTHLFFSTDKYSPVIFLYILRNLLHREWWISNDIRWPFFCTLIAGKSCKASQLYHTSGKSGRHATAWNPTHKIIWRWANSWCNPNRSPFFYWLLFG